MIMRTMKINAMQSSEWKVCMASIITSFMILIASNQQEYTCDSDASEGGNKSSYDSEGPSDSNDTDSEGRASSHDTGI